ncbi:MAG TPA: hypothetical protein VGO07_06710, partial [Candidatus Saccharimonadales bacterium]|nr:hypothetical protein [Candidatus Saccharimonadales bacterium]
MSRLPTPGSDDDSWGEILNDFLRVEHNKDGTLKIVDSLAAKIAVGGDIGGTAAEPRVTKVHLDGPLPINQGGTGAATQLFTIPRGPWQTQVSYQLSDTVTQYGASWRCLAAHTAGTSMQDQINSGYWEQNSSR